LRFTRPLLLGHLVDLRDPPGRKFIHREWHVCLLCQGTSFRPGQALRLYQVYLICLLYHI
jgi:hypothetical protein